jgi:hypothetical protein
MLHVRGADIRGRADPELYPMGAGNHH